MLSIRQRPTPIDCLALLMLPERWWRCDCSSWQRIGTDPLNLHSAAAAADTWSTACRPASRSNRAIPPVCLSVRSLFARSLFFTAACNLPSASVSYVNVNAACVRYQSSSWARHSASDFLLQRLQGLSAAVPFHFCCAGGYLLNRVYVICWKKNNNLNLAEIRIIEFGSVKFSRRTIFCVRPILIAVAITNVLVHAPFCECSSVFSWQRKQVVEQTLVMSSMLCQSRTGFSYHGMNTNSLPTVMTTPIQLQRKHCGVCVFLLKLYSYRRYRVSVKACLARAAWSLVKHADILCQHVCGRPSRCRG